MLCPFKEIQLVEYEAGCAYISHLDNLDATVATLAFTLVVAIVGGFSAAVVTRPKIFKKKKVFRTLLFGTLFSIFLIIFIWANYHRLYVNIQTAVDSRLIEIENELGMETRLTVAKEVFNKGERSSVTGYFIAVIFVLAFSIYCISLVRAVTGKRFWFWSSRHD